MLCAYISNLMKDLTTLVQTPSLLFNSVRKQCYRNDQLDNRLNTSSENILSVSNEPQENK